MTSTTSHIAKSLVISCFQDDTDLRDLLQLASPDGQRALSELRQGLNPEFVQRATRRLSRLSASTTLDEEVTLSLPSPKAAQ